MCSNHANLHQTLNSFYVKVFKGVSCGGFGVPAPSITKKGAQKKEKKRKMAEGKEREKNEEKKGKKRGTRKKKINGKR